MVERLTFSGKIFSSSLESSWFESSPFEATRSERTRRGWLTLTSFALQALLIAILLIVPLLRPSAFPSFHQLTTPVSLGPVGDTVPVIRSRTAGNGVSIAPSENAIHLPTHIPTSTLTSGQDATPESAPIGPFGLVTSGGGDPRGLRNLFAGETPTTIPSPPPLPAAHTVHVSHMSEGDLIRKLQPSYPPLARSARIQGTVVLQAIISKQGTIENLKVLSGHPMLIPSAIDAVRQWRYRPYILNGEPVEVETQITVNFSLAGS
jgi:periplasmic protein TonB